jgi:hypothetical protein
MDFLEKLNALSIDTRVIDVELFNKFISWKVTVGTKTVDGEMQSSLSSIIKFFCNNLLNIFFELENFINEPC